MLPNYSPASQTKPPHTRFSTQWNRNICAHSNKNTCKSTFLIFLAISFSRAMSWTQHTPHQTTRHTSVNCQSSYYNPQKACPQSAVQTGLPSSLHDSPLKRALRKQYGKFREMKWEMEAQRGMMGKRRASVVFLWNWKYDESQTHKWKNTAAGMCLW